MALFLRQGQRLHTSESSLSLASTSLRSITGAWKRPVALCLVDDRLYLVEEKDEDEDVDGELVNPQQGRRIFATSLQGDTLQVYTRVRAQCVEGHTFKSLCYFDGRLCWRPSKTWSRSMLG
jgi:hypothetical protein